MQSFRVYGLIHQKSKIVFLAEGEKPIMLDAGRDFINLALNIDLMCIASHDQLCKRIEGCPNIGSLLALKLINIVLFPKKYFMYHDYSDIL
jgi:hypothetical protein